jgi:spore germination cell wall hydrolase CwlJ-like protein
MIRTVRAAAIAVAVAAAAAFAATAPVQAGSGDAPTPTAYYLDHASADLSSDSLGLNQEGQPATQPTTVPEGARAGASLDQLVTSLLLAGFSPDTQGAEEDCLANAVYFEARGEPLQGQLAVAEVVMNRAASGRYPSTLCAVVVQPAQFSFVRRGIIPRADRASDAWRRAVAVARIAKQRMVDRVLPSSCLWYHANYVSPSWGRRLARNMQIGLHIFYS